MDSEHASDGCICCRRDFLATIGLATGGIALRCTHLASAAQTSRPAPIPKTPAQVRGVFLYPPSTKLKAPGGWWSWPGNDFDAEGRQRKYCAAIDQMQPDLGIQIRMNPEPVHEGQGVNKFIEDVKRSRPDALLLVPLHHPTFSYVDHILKATEFKIPTVIFTCLGVKHGSVRQYRRPGVCLIQSMDNLPALRDVLRMIQTRRIMRENRVLSVAGTGPAREASVPFWGTRVRTASIQHFADQVNRTPIDDDVRALARRFTESAKRRLEPSDAAILAAARVHVANKRMLEEERADAIMMDCLRRGEMMPCMSFMTLRDEGIAAGCENDLYPTLTLMLLQHLFDRPGFQHNPCVDTEANHYFASHCTSASKLHGTDRPASPYLLRSFAHTNDPTCVPQVLWKPGEKVTMVRLLSGKQPGMLLYTGNVVKSYEMPPVGGCRTNVAVTINELKDARDVKGHHNVLIYGDHGRRLRQFAQLHGIAVQT